MDLASPSYRVTKTLEVFRTYLLLDVGILKGPMSKPGLN